MTAVNLATLAYIDYIAARYLINNDFVWQGSILASTAIEKYLKVLLVIREVDISKIKYHLDNLAKLKTHFVNTDYIKLFNDYFDDYFLDILSKVYQFRYYDIKIPTSVGFLTNQFLGELDYTVFIIEQLLEAKDKANSIVHTKYQREVDNKEKNLFHNNYVLNEVAKKEFMEQSSNGFVIYYNPLNMDPILGQTTEKITVPYKGKMWKIEIREGTK